MRGCVMPGRFLSDDDRLRLSNFPDEVAESDLAAYYTVEDLACIRHRGDANRLGFALQLCTLPFLGFVPDDLGKPRPPWSRSSRRSST